MPLLIGFLIIFCIYLGWRLRVTGRIIQQLIDAAGHSNPVLLEEDSGFIQGFRLDELVSVFNHLITEKAKFSSSGQETNNQIQTLLGSLREAVVVVDEENAILSANNAFNELASLTDTPVDTRIDDHLQGPAFLEFQKEIRTEGTGKQSEVNVQINGKEFWLEVGATPLVDTNLGDGRYTLYVFQNVTQQKQLEKVRTEFVANVSHELKTPVTIIKGFAETLIEDGSILSEKERLRFLNKILNNSNRLHSLLQDLLLLARLESTEMILHLETFSLSHFLEELAENWKQGLGPEEHLVTYFAEGNDTVLADSLRLSQVVINLLENARIHAQGMTRIHIRTHVQKHSVSFSVEDDGAGISDKDLPHIFQRFYRADKGRSRESGGTGLGLSISKHLVGQHKGEIEARSIKGEGTRIIVTLPKSGSENSATN